MSSHTAKAFIAITVLAWLLVLYLFIKTQHSPSTTSSATSPVTPSLLHPIERVAGEKKDAISTIPTMHERERTEEPPPVLPVALVQAAQAAEEEEEKLPPKKKRSSSVGHEVESSHPLAIERKPFATTLHTHQPRSSESYKASPASSWEDFLAVPSEPLRPAHNFTKPTQVHVCGADVAEKLTQRLSKEELDWCKWALSPDGGRVQVSNAGQK